MSAQIKRFIVPDSYRTHPVKIIADGFTATVVLHADHLAAMAAASAYDEEKERALFEAAMTAEGFDVHLEPDFAGVYIGPVVHTMWQGWKRCAKARAKAAWNL